MNRLPQTWQPLWGSLLLALAILVSTIWVSGGMMLQTGIVLLAVLISADAVHRHTTQYVFPYTLFLIALFALEGFQAGWGGLVSALILLTLSGLAVFSTSAIKAWRTRTLFIVLFTQIVLGLSYLQAGTVLRAAIAMLAIVGLQEAMRHQSVERWSVGKPYVILILLFLLAVIATASLITPS